MAYDNNFSGATKLKDWWQKVKANFDFLKTKADNCDTFQEFNNKYLLPDKEFVRVASSTSVPLLTPSNGVLPTIDGVLVVGYDRVLVKDQIDQRQNGIYIVNPASSGVWQRATDSSLSAYIKLGMRVFVKEGTTNAQRFFVLSSASDNPIYLGSSTLVFIPEAVKARSIKSGSHTFSTVNHGTAYSYAVAFGLGNTFLTTPSTVCNVQTLAPENFVVSVESVSASGFTMRIKNIHASNDYTNVVVFWIAAGDI
ncbi:MAG: hypothetical protein WCQ41_09145 [Bacillota bacterium]